MFTDEEAMNLYRRMLEIAPYIMIMAQVTKEELEYAGGSCPEVLAATGWAAERISEEFAYLMGYASVEELVADFE